MRNLTPFAAWLLAVTATAGVSAQQRPAAPQAPAAAQPAAPPQPSTPAPPAESYSYNPEGRRDPFVSLLVRGSELNISREDRPDGREGLMIGELSVRGIVRTRNTMVAMVQGPDNKSYIIHPGDKLLDGVVKAITADAIVFAQDVNDPLSLVKQREVRKTLRVPEEGK
ncbi:MAG TPA: pilus assembly protein PilP [Vicinamibacterales bacterium]|nr:pilus assembly protein PilP [Vicinamibacterales bacterium]